MRDQLVNALHTSTEKVQVKQIFTGGGFGGKIYNQQAIEAALISKSCGKPVQLVWSRKEEFMYDRFRPAALMNITSGVDDNGKLNLWEFDIYCAGTRGTSLFYGVSPSLYKIYSSSSSIFIS